MSFEYANKLGKEGIPFIIIVSYDKSEVFVSPLSELKNHDIEFFISQNNLKQREIEHKIFSPDFSEYKERFEKIITGIKRGHTYVSNLTEESRVEIDSNLREIFEFSKAKYRIRFGDKFVSYSPETFIKIKSGKIETYPMKGTLDGSIENGEEILLKNEKEFAEHVMIVDLLRNDLNMVSKNVRVEKFREIEKIVSGNKSLYQMSSKIIGELEIGWESRIGTILEKILPAGSITGTPKVKTLEIIDEVENHKRNFFTGVFGVFDGKEFDSGVMIRYLEKRNGEFFYKSGGGITLDSKAEDEFDEVLKKIYLW
ncbi:anthranilate/para-aminobenzoate synthase component I [Thiovulum sp. ES]|nr:anthranilate/para-aminobenzoate synthase component I [Thiovulum sp. ES]